MDKEFIKVSKADFDAFVAAYPRPLSWNVTGICEPPLGSHNDFSDGKVWPESMVTKVVIMDGSEYYDGRTSEYYIKKPAPACDHRKWRSRIGLSGGMNKICDDCGEFLGRS